MFKEGGANFTTHLNQLPLDEPDTWLRDQVLLLWGKDTREPYGIPMRRELHNWSVFGLYRIQEATQLWTSVWRIVPYPDGWVRLSTLREPPPRFEQLSPGYLKSIEPSAARRFLQRAHERAGEPTGGLEPEEQSRLDHVMTHLDDWLGIAREGAQRLAGHFASDDEHAEDDLGALDPRWSGLAKLRATLPTTAPRPPALKVDPAPVRTEPPPAAAVPEPKPESGVDVREAKPFAVRLSETVRQAIRRDYGSEIVTRLLLATLTKSFLVLRGNPGAGKSRLATLLIDDPDRRLVVVVSSTWRGREDLLGYLNPIDSAFEPTDFCRLLCRAEDAWMAGDRTPWLVVFEEFNLSPPEFWLSEILARSQYDADNLAERRIELGGSGARGIADQRKHVFLSPAVRFVATLNADHTTRPLSPRVLDRASIVDVQSDPDRAIATARVELEEDQLEAIKELDFRVRHKGATFSVRTALSLKTCLDEREGLGLDAWKVLDVVLLQEVLTKVRLLTGDPADLDLVKRLEDWARDHAQRLPYAKARIQEFRTLLESGNDVV